MDKNLVVVFMSTYNGEKYICEQIDSIIQQNDVEVELWIRDDGSTDGTVSIVKDYSERYNNVFFCQESSLGVGRSFMKLIYECDISAGYYAFADQDDVWDADKLKCAVDSLNKFGNEPKLYVCNQRCVDENGKFISNRFSNDFIKQGFDNELFSNLYAGCTMVFNRAFKDILCDIKRRPDLEFFIHRIHDSWTACVASAIGVIEFDYQPHMSFRRHDNNVTDAEVLRYKKISFFVGINKCLKKFKRIIKRKNNKKRGVELTAKYLLEGYADLILDDYKDLLMTVRDYRRSICYKLKLLLGSRIRRAVPEKWLEIYIKIVFNIL